jgi:hypothetical protein
MIHWSVLSSKTIYRLIFQFLIDFPYQKSINPRNRTGLVLSKITNIDRFSSINKSALFSVYLRKRRGRRDIFTEMCHHLGCTTTVAARCAMSADPILTGRSSRSSVQIPAGARTHAHMCRVGVSASVPRTRRGMGTYALPLRSDLDGG